MKKIQLFFILLVTGLMIIPWFHLPQPELYGGEKEAPFPSFSWQAYAAGTYQKQFNAWWKRHFGSRNTMLVMKNDMYDMLNFGQFHSGNNKRIVQGRHGILFRQNYIHSKFFPYHAATVERNAAETVVLLAKLRDRLEAMGKHLLFILAPSKVDTRYDELPWLWEFRAKHTSVPPSMSPLWERELARKNIIYVNSLELMKKKNILKDAFPDGGFHWSKLAAGLVLEEGLKRVNHAGANFHPLRIKGEEISDRFEAFENELAKACNIWPPYHKGRSTWKVAIYQPIPAELSVSTICFGDSFSVAIYQNIIESGFSAPDGAALFWNFMPPKDEWFRQLSKVDLLVLTYTYPRLNEPRIKNELTTLMNYTDDFILRNWHHYEKSGKGQWSKYHSSVEFFHDAKKDCTFSFMIKKKFRAKELCLFINENKISHIALNKLSFPQKITVTIPQHLLRAGLNRLEFFSNGAVSPRSITPDRTDSRVLGVFCSDFNIGR